MKQVAQGQVSELGAAVTTQLPKPEKRRRRCCCARRSQPPPPPVEDDDVDTDALANEEEEETTLINVTTIAGEVLKLSLAVGSTVAQLKERMETLVGDCVYDLDLFGEQSEEPLNDDELMPNETAVNLFMIIDPESGKRKRRRSGNKKHAIEASRTRETAQTEIQAKAQKRACELCDNMLLILSKFMVISVAIVTVLACQKVDGDLELSWTAAFLPQIVSLLFNVLAFLPLVTVAIKPYQRPELSALLTQQEKEHGMALCMRVFPLLLLNVQMLMLLSFLEAGWPNTLGASLSPTWFAAVIIARDYLLHKRRKYFVWALELRHQRESKQGTAAASASASAPAAPAAAAAAAAAGNAVDTPAGNVNRTHANRTVEPAQLRPQAQLLGKVDAVASLALCVFLVLGLVAVKVDGDQKAARLPPFQEDRSRSSLGWYAVFAPGFFALSVVGVCVMMKVRCRQSFVVDIVGVVSVVSCRAHASY
jgi:hypothetical protein